ncbi:MAG: hypothetical protein IKN54_00170, partial [Lachnospiraceae bacterium]|nr:hypothetical protein [Lachnospiraceae bacterium]
GIDPQVLEVGDTFTYTFNYTVTDDDLTKGTISIGGHADADGKVVEISDDNNYGTPVVVSIVETERPDLIITSITAPSNSYAIGDVIPLTITMKNDSEIDAELAQNNLTIKARINGNDYGNNWYIVPKVENQNNTIVPAGGSVTGVINYTVKAEDIVDGFIRLSAKADADGGNNGNIVEANENNNILEAAPIKVVEHGTTTLAYNPGADDDETTAFVTVTWTEKSGTSVTGYELEYIDSANEVHRVIITDENITKTTEGDVTTYVYSLPVGTRLKYKSDVNVLATYDDEITQGSQYYPYAAAVALPDLVITDIVSKEAEPKKNIGFSATATVKNIGVAEVPQGIDDMDHYGTWMVVTMHSQTSAPGVQGDHTVAGFAIGQSRDIDINNIVVEDVGNYSLVFKADDADFSQQSTTGFIDELNEDNNTAQLGVDVGVDQSPMDWTPLQINMTTETDPYEFIIAATSSTIEYKVLDTTIGDIGYKDIFSNYTGYNGTYMSMALSSSKYQMLPIYNEDNESKSKARIYFSQVSKEYCDNYTDSQGQTYQTLDKLSSVQNAVIVDSEGNILKENSYGTSPLVYNGNGFIYNVDSWGLGKHYVMVLVNPDGTSITVAFRVTTGTGRWIRAGATDSTDPDRLPFYYHRGSRLDDEEVEANYNETTGTFYYDASDFGLSSITSYNGNHLSLILDPSYSLPVSEDQVIDELPNGEPAWKVMMSEAVVTVDGEDIVVSDPGDEADWVTWNGAYDGVVGRAGTNNIKMQLPNLMRELPVHSSKGGQRDDEYYFMRIYYNEKDHNGSYVSIPVRVAADIPMIEEPKNLDVTTGSTQMHISFGESEMQQLREYYYTINIYSGIGQDKSAEPVASSVANGLAAVHHPDGTSSITSGGTYSYDVSGLTTVGSKYTVEVITEWCEQSVETIYEYEVREPEAGNVEILGFQMNPNISVGGVSEYAPSFRIVSRAAKQIKNANNEICGVVSFGTIYAFEEDIDSSELTVEGAQANDDDNIYVIQADETGTYRGYVSGKYDDSLQNYFAMTIKPIEYYYELLTRPYKVRAYAQLDDGSIVYSINSYTVSVNEIAEYLYQNKMMPNKEGHEYLYNNVLNIVAMNTHSGGIANAMCKALGVTSSKDARYAKIKTAYNEVLWYTRCTNGHTYAEHQTGTVPFAHLDENGTEVLGWLNEARGTEYETLYDWIANETTKLANSSNVHYAGCYEKVAYEWQNELIKDFDTE